MNHLKSHPKRTFSAVQAGFTLIEIMVVVAIIGILSSIAYPAYVESVSASRRADMQRALGEAEQFMRRYYSARDTYKDAVLPTQLTQSPREGGAVYTISLIESSAAVNKATKETTFELRATRTGTMSSDKCGDLSVDQTGAKTIANNKTGTSLSSCFKGS
jgi:type IV pilus assembly protein PilE